MRDEKTENWLRAQGVEFQYLPTVSLAQIDKKASRANRARLYTPIIIELVEQYKRAMEDGAQFPAIIIHESRNGYVIINGNHRDEAYRLLGRKFTDAYLVSNVSAPYVLERLIRSANQIEGLPPSREEAIEHCVWMVETFERPIVEIARMFNVSEHVLGSAVRLRKQRNRMAALNIPHKALSNTATEKLYGIPNDEALKKAVQLTQDARLSEAQLTGLVKAVREQRTEKDQIAAVEEFASRPDIVSAIQQTGRGRVKRRVRTPEQMTLSMISGLTTQISKETTVSMWAIASNDDRGRLFKSWNDLQEAMNALMEKANAPAHRPL